MSLAVAGHSHPVLKEAAIAALGQGINLGGHSEPELELAQVCAAITQQCLFGHPTSGAPGKGSLNDRIKHAGHSGALCQH